jgi:hypothetical protein
MPLPPGDGYLMPQVQFGDVQFSIGRLDQREVLIPLLVALRHVVNDVLTLMRIQPVPGRRVLSDKRRNLWVGQNIWSVSVSSILRSKAVDGRTRRTLGRIAEGDARAC